MTESERTYNAGRKYLLSCPESDYLAMFNLTLSGETLVFNDFPASSSDADAAGIMAALARLLPLFREPVAALGFDADDLPFTPDRPEEFVFRFIAPVAGKERLVECTVRKFYTDDDPGTDMDLMYLEIIVSNPNYTPSAAYEAQLRGETYPL